MLLTIQNGDEPGFRAERRVGAGQGERGRKGRERRGGLNLGRRCGPIVAHLRGAEQDGETIIIFLKLTDKKIFRDNTGTYLNSG